MEDSLYLTFKSEHGCLVITDVRIYGKYMETFLTNDTSCQSHSQVQSLHKKATSTDTFKFVSNAQQLYDEINLCRYLNPKQKESEFKENV